MEVEDYTNHMAKRMLKYRHYMAMHGFYGAQGSLEIPGAS